MDIREKINELIFLIKKYFQGEIDISYLDDFSWEVIKYFSQKNISYPPEVEGEREFWYAIWLIQHLGDEEHEKEGVTAKNLKEALEFLEKKQNFPADYIGKRPLSD
jgi:hypothetical protein